jgi:hypothetical protein
MSAIEIHESLPSGRKKIAFGIKKVHLRSDLRTEDEQLIEAVYGLKRELDYLYNEFNYVTDPNLIEGCIYDIKAVHAKYAFYIKQCKARQLKSI